jgi:hypothetical protein
VLEPLKTAVVQDQCYCFFVLVDLQRNSFDLSQKFRRNLGCYCLNQEPKLNEKIFARSGVVVVCTVDVIIAVDEGAVHQ